MLFKYHEEAEVLESEKERNLYYKFFAGYFFNELVDGYQQRVAEFYEFLFPETPDDFCFGKPFKSPENRKAPELSVTFDFHGYLLDKSGDRGELADILIQDHTNNLFIAIEAKFLSDWDYDKDIVKNSERITKLEKLTKQIFQVLLLKNDKLGAVENKKPAPNSNLRKLESEFERDEKKEEGERKLKYPFRIITWEQLFALCNEQKVTAYFSGLISREKKDFSVHKT